MTSVVDLPTHASFGFAVGLVFFGSPLAALVVGLGALLPDLDREYWYIPEKKYAEEQRHRALFHNVLIVALAYVVSPLLSLGVFLHVLQDSFTTVKDRGVEWFYPFTRLAKRGMYDSNGNLQPQDSDERVYFYQEDPPGLVKLADPDLQEPNDQPVPWRRVYGFAQNSHLLDRGFLFGSIAIAALWLADPANSGTVSSFVAPVHNQWGISIGYLGVALMFASGETQSATERARTRMGLQVKRDQMARLSDLKPIQMPLLVIGMIFFSLWAALYSGTIVQNARTLSADLPLLIACVASVLLVGLSVVKWQTRGGRRTVV